MFNTISFLVCFLILCLISDKDSIEMVPYFDKLVCCPFCNTPRCLHSSEQYLFQALPIELGSVGLSHISQRLGLPSFCILFNRVWSFLHFDEQYCRYPFLGYAYGSVCVLHKGLLHIIFVFILCFFDLILK